MGDLNPTGSYIFEKIELKPCTLGNLNLNSEGKYDPKIQQTDSFWPYDTELTQTFVERYH